jgi:ketosteroid isomerase-like protein
MRSHAPLVLFTLVTLAPQQPASQPRPRPTAAPNEDMKSLVSRQYTALAEGNFMALRTLYADGAQLAFFAPTGGRQTASAEYLQTVEEFRKGNGLRWSGGRDVTVTPLGATVAVTATGFKADGAAGGGQPVSIEGRHTAVWQKTGTQWRIVHEHLSAPWTAPAPTTTTPVANAPQIVADVLNTYQQAWTEGDAAALGALWDDNGDIGSLGAPVSTRGRQAVTDFWTQSISRRRSPTVVQAAATSARGVSGEVITADGAFEYRAKGAAVTAAPASVDRFSLSLRKSGEQWKISALRIAAGK